jgi:hypothetical protein
VTATDPNPERRSWADRLRSEVSFATVVSGGILVGAGWALTWARLKSEGLEPEGVLSELPAVYFIHIGITSFATAALLAATATVVWVLLWEKLAPSRDVAQRWTTVAWVGLGIASALLGYATASPDDPGGNYARSVALTALGLLAAGGLVGWLASDRMMAAGGGPARPWIVAALTFPLFFLGACAMRVWEARYSGNVLPVAQVVVGSDCYWLTEGSYPDVGVDGRASRQNPRCVIGAYYLGKSANWTYLTLRAGACQFPLLVQLPSEDIEEIAILDPREVPSQRAQGEARNCPASPAKQRP